MRGPTMDARPVRRAAMLAAVCGLLLLSGGCALQPLDSLGDPGRVSVRVEVARSAPVAASHAPCPHAVG